MIVVQKVFFQEFDIGISEYSNFEGRQYQLISAKFSNYLFMSNCSISDNV